MGDEEKNFHVKEEQLFNPKSEQILTPEPDKDYLSERLNKHGQLEDEGAPEDEI